MPAGPLRPDEDAAAEIRTEAELRAREQAARHLLAWSKELQRAQTFEELVDAAGREVERRTGYAHVWLYVLELDLKTATWIAGRDADSGAQRPTVTQLSVEGDAMIDELMREEQPLVVADARTDPRTNKQIVARMGNRTIINVPLIVFEQRLGAFGLGTIGDEGCRTPTPAELEYITAMASHLAVAVDRVRAIRERDEAMLEQQRLRERVLRAEKLESIGLLAGGVAHDVNNLMTVVLGSLDRAILGAPHGDASQAFEDIREAATRARDLANRMLALSGRGSLPTRAVCLNQVARETATELRSALPKGVQLSCWSAAAEALWVSVEREQVAQLVRNLVANACDAIGDRSGSIELSAARLDAAPDLEHSAAFEPLAAGPYAVLEIVDSGTGMSQATQAKLFEPFFTTRGVGRGLGLAVVHGIVLGHQGAIRFTSDLELGDVPGTKVEVFLPLRDAPPATAPRRPATSWSIEGSPTVLLVDDDPSVRSTTRMLLEHRGYRVTEAASGEDALEALRGRAREAHLVMLDLTMPTMSGREVYRHIRAQRPDLPILLCSGYDSASLDSFELSGPTEFLQKPYDLAALTAALEGLRPQSPAD